MLFRGILILSILVIVVLLGICQDLCNDVWAHALHGRIIIEKGRFPRFSDYSFVRGEDVPLNTDAVPSVIFYLLLKLGYPALLLFKIAGIGLAVFFFLLWLREEDVSWSVSAVAATLFMLAAQTRFLPRGDLFNIGFLAVFLYLLARYHRRHDRSLWLLPMVEFFWIQFHYLACLGIFAVLCYASEELKGLRRENGAIVSPSLRVLLKVSALCLIASFFNEGTYRKAFQPFATLLHFASPHREMYEIIVEFSPIFFYIGEWKIAPPTLLIRFIGPFILAVALLTLKRREVMAPHLLLFAAASLAALRFTRFLGIYALVGIGIAAIYFWKWRTSATWERSIAELAVAVFNGLIAASVATGALFSLEGRIERCRPSLLYLHQPAGAVEFLKQRQAGGNIYTNFNPGGFIGYHLYPQGKIFVHSLCLWYSLDIYGEFKAIWEGRMDPNLLAKRYSIETFVLIHYLNLEVIQQLHNARDCDGTPLWKLVYLDESSVVYVRKDSSLAKFSIEPASFSPAGDLSSYGACWLGHFFMVTGYYEKARIFYHQALAEIKTPLIYQNLGLIARYSGDDMQALEYFVAAMQIEPNAFLIEEIENLVSPHSQPRCRQALDWYLKWKEENLQKFPIPH